MGTQRRKVVDSRVSVLSSRDEVRVGNFRCGGATPLPSEQFQNPRLHRVGSPGTSRRAFEPFGTTVICGVRQRDDDNEDRTN